MILFIKEVSFLFFKFMKLNYRSKNHIHLQKIRIPCELRRMKINLHYQGTILPSVQV